MSLTKANSPGWGLGNKATSAQLNHIDNMIVGALDKRDGQTDTLESRVALSSNGKGRIVDSTLVISTGSWGYTELPQVIDVTYSGGATSITLANTGRVLGDRVRVRASSTSQFTTVLANDGTTVLAVLGGATGEAHAADFYFDGTDWTLWDKKKPLLPKHGGTGLDNSAASGFVLYTAGAPSVVAAPAGSLVGTTATQTLTNKTLSSPTVTGATTANSSDSKVTVLDTLASVETTDATQTTAYVSGTLADEAVHSIDAIITAIKSDGTAAAVYKRNYCGRRDGGTWTQLTAVSDNMTEETSSAWDATIDVNANAFRVRVTGASSTTIRWGVAVRIQSTVP